LFGALDHRLISLDLIVRARGVALTSKITAFSTTAWLSLSPAVGSA
jgi:hypothetical protein